jgi:predicted amidophosphoribosyltransferase
MCGARPTSNSTSTTPRSSSCGQKRSHGTISPPTVGGFFVLWQRIHRQREPARLRGCLTRSLTSPVMLRTALVDLLDAMLPARCPGCGRRGALVCEACAATLAPAPTGPPPAPIEWWTSCFAYEGVARELVARAKYRNERRFLVLVADALARAVDVAPASIDLVTWAPASAARVRAQGVDHGELLARAVARLTHTQVRACLTRAPGAAQTGLDARARRRGPRLQPIGRVDGATVLVVDDVATTGGTLAAAARALRAAGAPTVLAATIARTPRPGAGRGPATYTPSTPTGDRPSRNSIGSTWTSSSSEST